MFKNSGLLATSAHLLVIAAAGAYVWNRIKKPAAAKDEIRVIVPDLYLSKQGTSRAVGGTPARVSNDFTFPTY